MITHGKSEVCELLSTDKFNTSAYHPVTDVLVEPFNSYISRSLLKSDAAIQRYSDTQSRSRGQSQNHANFPGGVNFTPYKVKYISGNVKIYIKTVEYDVCIGVNVE